MNALTIYMENFMKKFITALLILGSATTFAADCSYWINGQRIAGLKFQKNLGQGAKVYGANSEDGKYEFMAIEIPNDPEIDLMIRNVGSKDEIVNGARYLTYVEQNNDERRIELQCKK